MSSALITQLYITTPVLIRLLLQLNFHLLYILQDKFKFASKLILKLFTKVAKLSN